VENAEFKAAIKVLFDEKCRGYHTNVDVGEVLRGVLNLVRIHHIRINANYATLVVNVLCIEALARKLLPHYNILDGGKPLLNSYRRFLVDKPRSKIRKLLFKMALPFAELQRSSNDKRFFKNHALKLAGLYKKKTKRAKLLKKFAQIGLVAGGLVLLKTGAPLKIDLKALEGFVEPAREFSRTLLVKATNMGKKVKIDLKALEGFVEPAREFSRTLLVKATNVGKKAVSASRGQATNMRKKAVSAKRGQATNMGKKAVSASRGRATNMGKKAVSARRRAT